MSIEIRVTTTFSDIDDLASTLTDELDDIQLIQLIRAIDVDMENSEFTEQIIKLARKLKKELKADV